MTSVYLAVAYALTGFTEEAWARGIFLRVLLPASLWHAVLPSVVLFGALRLRTNTIWPLVVMHAFENFLLHFTRPLAIPPNVVQSIIFLIYGLYLMRNRWVQEPAQAV